MVTFYLETFSLTFSGTRGLYFRRKAVRPRVCDIKPYDLGYVFKVSTEYTRVVTSVAVFSNFFGIFSTSQPRATIHEAPAKQRPQVKEGWENAKNGRGQVKRYTHRIARGEGLRRAPQTRTRRESMEIAL